jgi:hypothetical protein
MAANATKDWNNALGQTLQRLTPVFGIMTGLGVALMTATKIIKATRVAMLALQAATISTAGVFGILGASLGAVGLLVYGLSRIFPAMKADTERWSAALDKANDSLKELEDNGQGSSAEANILRDAIDDLTYSLGRFNQVGEDNVVTTTNLDAAIEKLAVSKRKLEGIDAGLLDMMEGLNENWRYTTLLWKAYDIAVGDTASDVVELTANILDLKDAQIEELDTIRDDAVKVIEDYYGLRSFQTQSLIEQFEDETEAQQDSLNEQLKDVRENTNDVIAQYRKEYNARVKLLDAETEAVVGALQDQLDALNDAGEDAGDEREDESFEDEKSRIEKELAEAWTRKDRARLEKELADLLKKRAEDLADRERDVQKKSLQKQIQDVQNAASQKKAEWQEELDVNIENQNAILEASELTIGSQLDALENAMIAKRIILQQELNDAVAYHNAIRDNAIAAINTVINAQLAAAGVVTTPLWTPAPNAVQPPIPYEYQGGGGAQSGGAILPNGPMVAVPNPIIPQGQLWAHVPGYATGGPIIEDSLLVGLRSGRPYAMAHEGERVTPGGGGDIIVNVNGAVSLDGKTIGRFIAVEVSKEQLRNRNKKGNMGS